MSQTTVDLPSALTHVDEILARARGRRLALFLDYDGTLTPIVQRPELAQISPPMRDTVRALAEDFEVAIVSGRGLADVKRLVGLDELTYAGSHGFEIEGPAGSGLSHREGEGYAPTLAAVEGELRDAVAGIEGALVERKAFSVAVHYRLVAAEEVTRVTQAVDDALARHDQLHKGHGKCVYELQPAIDWHKGQAVLWLTAALERRLGPVLPLYIGDDVTDENAFRSLPAHGIGVVVCDVSRETAAQYLLGSTNEVQQFLLQLRSNLPRP